MSSYDRLRESLEIEGRGSARFTGNSMMPIIKSGSRLTFERQDDYAVGYIVFCKVKGNYMTHKIVKSDDRGRYLIANNEGRLNGWTTKIYGKLVEIESPG